MFDILPFLLPMMFQLTNPLDDGKTCINQETVDMCMQAGIELDDIHESPAEIFLEEPIIIIQDWDGRVYINGGEKKPLKATLTIGKFIERDLEIELPISIQKREKPPEPMFRLRYRAQAGVLVPQVMELLKKNANQTSDIQLGLDFFHYNEFNLSVNLGIVSCGTSVGMDITKNFGIMTGYSFIYSKLSSAAIFGIYFSFN